MKIIWSNQALKTYDKIIDDLILNWPINIVINFEDKTNTLLDHLKNNSKLCPPSKKMKLRKCVIHKNASLVYRFNKTNIELITFLDNRSEHNY